MAAERPWAYLDDMTRAELPNWTKDLADTLDEWLFRMHGVMSGGHHVGVFLQFAEDHGLAVAPRVAAASGSREAGDQDG